MIASAKAGRSTTVDQKTEAIDMGNMQRAANGTETDPKGDGSWVDPSLLYDGPQVNGHDAGSEGGKSAELFSDQQPPEPIDQAQMLKVVFEILSTRVLGLVATVAACVLWGLAVWSPDLSRTGAAFGFSVTVLIPICALYWRSKP